MGSFHLEIMAAKYVPAIISALRSNSTEVNFSNIISIFFEIAKDDLIAPVKIPNSHSPHLTHSPADALSHSNAFQAITRHCSLIDRQTSPNEKIKMWRTLFGDPFPTEQSI
jgi:hypothetical protein